MTTLPGLTFEEDDDGGGPNGRSIGEETRHVLRVINAYRASLSPPYQSHFRVIALVVYKDGQGKVSHVCGANAEPCTIGGSICAERAALISLRHVPPPVQLLRIYVVTDEAKDALFPGILCKEYLSSMADDSLPIYVANAKTTDVRSMALGELFPFASLYRHTDRSDLVATGRALAEKREAPEVGSPAARLYEEVLKATARCVGRLIRRSNGERVVNHSPSFNLTLHNPTHPPFLPSGSINHTTPTHRDDKDDFHPIRYAAGVLFADGSHVVAWQKKGIEYGTTIDAIVQLAHAMESHKALGLTLPVLILQSDQFGNLHAPSGHARGFLMEYGYEKVLLYVHDTSTGALRSVTVGETAPGRPLISFGGGQEKAKAKENGKIGRTS